MFVSFGVGIISFFPPYALTFSRGEKEHRCIAACHKVGSYNKIANFIYPFVHLLLKQAEKCDGNISSKVGFWTSQSPDSQKSQRG